MKNYYQILGITSEAKLSEIKKAYRRLSIKFHPDKNPDDDGYFSDMFKQINEAYEVLSDEQKREEYDASYKGADQNGKDFDDINTQDPVNANEEASVDPYLRILIGVNILFYLLTAISSGSIFSINIEDLAFWGGLTYDVFNTGEIWRLLTSQFLHGDIKHIAFNMYILFSIGTSLLTFIDRKKFISIYLMTGIIAQLSSAFFGNYYVSVGASGAIFGITGFYFSLLYLLNKEKIFKKDSGIISGEMRSLAFFLGINLVFGFLSSTIDNAAHLGGLFGGGVLGLIYNNYYLNYSQESDQSKSQADLKGMKGWLIILLLHQIWTLVVTGFLIIISIYKDGIQWTFSESTIRYLLDDFSIRTIIFLEKLDIAFTSCGFIECVLLLVTFYMFIKMKKYFLSLFIVRTIFSISIVLYFGYYEYYDDLVLWSLLIWNVIYLIIYTTYFMRSKRVKLTFVN